MTELFDVRRVQSPWREILERELEKLKARRDVLAVGVAGSIAYGDTWSGSDLDIEVIVEGNKPKEIITTEQEISVDYGFFGETHINEVPFDTKPIFDPTEVLTNELSSRNRQLWIRNQIQEHIDQAQDLHRRGIIALQTDLLSALVFVHIIAGRLAPAFTLAAGENTTIRRTATRLEKAAIGIGRLNFFEVWGTLFGFTYTLEKPQLLLDELQAGYREVWSHFKGKPIGPVYMQLQPDSEAWFHNRLTGFQL